MNLGTAQIIQGNALDLPLADNSVDAVITSPPYFALRSYQDGGQHYDGQIGSEPTPAEFLDALLAATREMVRVLKPSGSIFINLGDKYAGSRMDGSSGWETATLDHDPGKKQLGRLAASQGALRTRTTIPTKSLMGIPWRYAIACIDDLGLILRAEIIWNKPNGLPESVTDRVRRSHEQWFHFTVQPRYFAAVDKIREEIAPAGLARRAYAYKPGHEGGTNGDSNGPLRTGGMRPANELGKLPGSVWSVPTQPLTVPPELGVDHFAAYPMEWPRRIIQGWTPNGGTVLDPFMGTGTTLVVARALGRNSIGVDLSADYCRLATWRCNDPRELAAALQVEKPEIVHPDQMDLFSEAT